MRYFGASDVGLHRKQNQDSYGIFENEQQEILALVCDGIGGGLAGDVASHMAVTHLKERFLTHPIFQSDQDVKKWVQGVIKEANDLIFVQSAKSVDFKGMGTTCVGLIYALDTTYIFNVGDSRIYGVYNHALIPLTEDHSFVQDLLKAGEITEEEAKHHPNRNMLTNALGIWDAVKVDVNKIRKDYQMILICSDGLHAYVNESDILQVLENKNTFKQKVFDLIELSKNAGGYDNVSVILLDKAGGCDE